MLGGSTNAVLRMLAFAGRFGVPFALREFDTLAPMSFCRSTCRLASRSEYISEGTTRTEDLLYLP